MSAQTKNQNQSPKFTRFEVPQVLLSWTAPTRRFQPKTQLWYLGLIVMTIGIVVFLFFFREFMLGLFIISLGILIYVQSAVKPPYVTCSIYNSGVEAGGKMYLWDDLDSFFIDLKEETLILKTKLSFPNELSLFLEAGKEKDIEDLLLDKLPFVELKRTDYLSVIDGFIGRFAQKLPKNFTKKVVKHPEQKVTVNPKTDNLSKQVKEKITQFLPKDHHLHKKAKS